MTNTTTREGKVLSAENEAKIKKAHAHLKDVLAEGGITDLDEVDFVDADEIHAGDPRPKLSADPKLKAAPFIPHNGQWQHQAPLRAGSRALSRETR